MSQLKEHLQQLDPSLTKTTARDFNEVKLTEEEISEALRQAREDKFYREKRAAYWADVDKQPEQKLFTPEELKGLLKAAKTPSGKAFSIDKDNEEIVRLLTLYFSNDPEFENSKDINGSSYSLKKGLALMGNLGVGKTFMMGFFCQNQNQSYRMANCRKIEGLWIDQMSNKEKPLKNVIEYYSTSIDIPVNSNPFGAQAIGVCFDDLGTETSPSKAYGEEKNVLAEILMNRYESGLPFNYTHITTNLSPHDIGLKYGTRVRDRFREMFNLIQFGNEAKSRR